jgi:ABC-2 type transport system ATP-binding protein
MIKLVNVKKYFGKQVAINIPLFETNEGDIVGVIGNNGAGKTTLFKLILDVIKADTGIVYSRNEDISTTDKWKNYTSAFINEDYLIKYLTSIEYFNFIGITHGFSEEKVNSEIKKYQDFFNEEKAKLIRDLSKGNQYKVGIIGSIINPPKILILDEPFANLDPSSQINLVNILKKLSKDSNTIILVSSHDLNHISELCNRIIVMNKGEIQADIPNTINSLEKIKKYFI